MRADDGVLPSSTNDRHSTFLQDCWYAAAWDEEVGDKPFGRTICGEKLVFMRKSDGTISALSGLCPHRFASLELGKILDGDRLQCPYHGLEFDAVGHCVANPHGAIPRVVRLRAYPVVERHAIIWLWMGDPDRADPSLIPDFSCMTDPRYRTIRGLLVTRAHYELITDNLMDLTHVGYIHHGSIGSDAVKDGRHEVLRVGTTLHSNRMCVDAPAPPVWDALFGHYGRNVDHWLNMRWDAPATMLLDVGVTPAGAHRSEGIMLWGAHLLTPETETSTHYFWSGSRDFALDDAELDAGLRASFEHAFIEEDKPMIEDIQRNMKGRSFEEMRPLILSFDEGAVRARRLLSELMRGQTVQRPSIPDLTAVNVNGTTSGSLPA